MAKNWWDEANEMTMGTILTKLGANPYKDNRWGPCPLCGEDQERKIPRPPVRIFWRNGYETFSCNRCQVWGSHFELMSRYHFGVSSWTLRNQGRFHELKKHYLDCDDKVVHVPRVIKPQVVYPPKDEVIAFLKSCVGFEKDSKEAKYLIGRGVNPWNIPAKKANPETDCTLLSIRDGSDKPWWQNEWLQRFPITVPLMNYKAEVKSVLGRSVRKNTTWKSTTPKGYSATNLFMFSTSIIKWIKGGEAPDKIWITEGEIDFLHLCSIGAHVIGIRNTAIDQLKLLPWKHFQKCYIATDADQSGERYAKKIPELVIPATPFRVKFKGVIDESD